MNDEVLRRFLKVNYYGSLQHVFSFLSLLFSGSLLSHTQLQIVIQFHRFFLLFQWKPFLARKQISRLIQWNSLTVWIKVPFIAAQFSISPSLTLPTINTKFTFIHYQLTHFKKVLLKSPAQMQNIFLDLRKFFGSNLKSLRWFSIMLTPPRDDS